MQTISEAQKYDLSKHGVGAIGGDAVWGKINELQPMFEKGIVCAPDIDGLVTVNGCSLIPRIDLIVMLGVAALAELEQGYVISI